MANGINKVILVGNLGRVEIKESKYGQIVNFSLATSYKNKEKTEDITEWHNCVAFNKTAEFAAKYLKTGLKLYVEGSLKTEKYQTQSGENRYTTKIVVRDFQILTPKSESENKEAQTDSADYQKAKDGLPPAPPPPSAYDGESAFPEDDIPF